MPAYGSRPWESPSWLAYPTLTHGKGTQIKCAGAYYHQHEIRAAVVQMHGSFVMAELRIETEGDYPGAVRVFVGGVQLASIPHDYTLAFQSVVEELGRASRPATLHVRLEADDYVDVWGFCEPKVRAPDEPLLCPQETEFVNLHGSRR